MLNGWRCDGGPGCGCALLLTLVLFWLALCCRFSQIWLENAALRFRSPKSGPAVPFPTAAFPVAVTDKLCGFGLGRSTEPSGLDTTLTSTSMMSEDIFIGSSLFHD